MTSIFLAQGELTRAGNPNTPPHLACQTRPSH